MLRELHLSPDAARELLEAIQTGQLSLLGNQANDWMTGATDCPEGCTVESDGTCVHGYRSAALTAWVI